MDSDEEFNPDRGDVAALKEYVDDRIESVRQSQEQQWLGALRAAGFDRETIENSVNQVASHGMTRRAALGVVAASVFGAGVFTGQASAAPGDDGDTVWGSDSNRSDWYADLIDANKVVATEGQYEQGDITGETSIKASLSSPITGINEGTSTNIVDTEDEDNLNELDSNLEFSPQETAEYRIQATVGITPGADQDRLNLILRESNGAYIRAFSTIVSSSTNEEIFGNVINVNLDSSTTYKVVTRDRDSTFDVERGYLTVKNEVVHS